VSSAMIIIFGDLSQHAIVNRFVIVLYDAHGQEGVTVGSDILIILASLQLRMNSLACIVGP
jgi:hypothetical protein